jgi:hypothetical protein
MKINHRLTSTLPVPSLIENDTSVTLSALFSTRPKSLTYTHKSYFPKLCCLQNSNWNIHTSRATKTHSQESIFTALGK